MFHEWQNATNIGKTSYQCGFCSNKVGPIQGYSSPSNSGNWEIGKILICPTCTRPTYFDQAGKQYPSVRMGNEVNGVTDSGVLSLYLEARDCTSLGAHTAAVLILRKVLMNIAVQQGAKEGETFASYIEYLEKSGYVPPNGKPWVDEIRKKGNEATHEIKLMTMAESKQLIHFVEMLLRFIYEFPSLLSPSSP